MKWLTKLRQATAASRAVPACEECGTRDKTIADQRAELNALRAELRAWRTDAVQNLHAMFTLHLVESAAAQGDQLGVDSRKPNWIREYALTFMAEAAGFEIGTRVTIAAHRCDGSDKTRLPGTVRDVWLDSCGIPTLSIAMDNRSDTEWLTNHGFELADVDLPASFVDHGLVVVPFPTTGRSIDAGGWIEPLS